MSDMTDATVQDPLGSTDFGGGVSESPFGQDAGASGSQSSGASRGPTQNLRDQATEKLRSFADEGKQQVTNSLDGLVAAAREIADKIGDKGGPLGGYATTAADTLQDWAEQVKTKSVEDLVEDGREFARRSPAVAIGIAVAAGFAISRVLKSGGGGRYAV